MQDNKKTFISLHRLVPNICCLLVALILLIIMWLFSGLLDDLYQYIGLKGEEVPNYAFWLYIISIFVILLLGIINLTFYLFFSRASIRAYRKKSFTFQLICNMICLIIALVVLIGIGAWANLSMKALADDKVIKILNINLIYIPISVSLILFLVLSFLQMCIWPPEDRAKPIWKNHVDQ